MGKEKFVSLENFSSASVLETIKVLSEPKSVDKQGTAKQKQYAWKLAGLRKLRQISL